MQIDRYTHRGYTVVIDTDESPSDPRYDTDCNVGVMAAFHRRYLLGDHVDEVDTLRTAMDARADTGRPMTFALIERYCRIAFGSTVVKPLYLLDHSGLSLSTGSFSHVDPGGWDSGILGFIFDTAHSREITGCPLDKIDEALTAEVKVYDQYLNGDVYGYTVLDKRENVIDSCWGFYGVDDAKREAESSIPDKPDNSLTDAAALDLLVSVIDATAKGTTGKAALPNIIQTIERTGRKVLS